MRKKLPIRQETKESQDPGQILSQLPGHAPDLVEEEVRVQRMGKMERISGIFIIIIK